jgi:ATP-binding cassette subfamily B protein RaxB
MDGVCAPSTLTSKVEIRALRFRYGDSGPWVIDGFNLTIEPGECVAVTAPSGAGKTTLAKLVMGLLIPMEGEIRFGGVDIYKLGLARYRSLAAAVMQDDQLFAGSIVDNISLSDAGSNLEKVEGAAKLARIHDDIMAMPMGYQTLIGQRGASLSGGQCQRVMLARALYRDPRVLILDEATSHLDVAKEREISALIKELKITRLVLAHRTETISSADRVVVLGKRHLEDGGFRPSRECSV